MKRIFSMVLAISIMFTVLPISVMAEEITNGKSGEIIAFTQLEETEKAVKIGTSVEDLGLPKTLNVTVQTTKDSVLATDSNITIVADSEWIQVNRNIPVTWTSKPEYDKDVEGEYLFTPVVTNDYTTSADLPEIIVTVGEVPPTAPAKMMLLGNTVTEISNLQELIDVISKATGDLNLKLKSGYTGTGQLTVPEYNYDITIDLNGQTMDGSYSFAIAHEGNGTLTIKNGTVIANTGGSAAIFNSMTGTLKVIGVTVVNEKDRAISNEQKGIVEIYGSTICSKTNTAIVNLSGKIKFTGGTSIIQGSTRATYSVSDVSQLTNVKITGSKTDMNGLAATVISASDIDTDEKIQAYKYLKFEPMVAKNKNTNVEFSTLQAAVDSVTAGQTIELM